MTEPQINMTEHVLFCFDSVIDSEVGCSKVVTSCGKNYSCGVFFPSALKDCIHMFLPFNDVVDLLTICHTLLICCSALVVQVLKITLLSLQVSFFLKKQMLATVITCFFKVHNLST